MGGKGDKTSSVAIPPWLEQELKPYLGSTLQKNRTFADKTWANMMPGQAHISGDQKATYGAARDPAIQALLRAGNDNFPDEE